MKQPVIVHKVYMTACDVRLRKALCPLRNVANYPNSGQEAIKHSCLQTNRFGIFLHMN